MDSNASCTNGKPPANGKTGRSAKPYDDFPLFEHAVRRWAKEIRGKLHYLGPWSDRQGALKK